MSLTIISDIVNDRISVIVSRGENKVSTSTCSRRRMTTEAKLALADYFDRGENSRRTRLFLVSTLLVMQNLTPLQGSVSNAHKRFVSC